MRGLGVLLAAAAALIAAGTALALTPDDPLWDQSWAQRTVEMPRAWNVTTGDPKIVVAVIDTGIQARTQDLKGAVLPGWDFLENDANPQDLEGHGTVVSTIIAGRGDNGVGVAGYCWKCKIMPLRVSAWGDANTAAIAQAIDYAVAHGARVINIDFSDGGLEPADPGLSDAIARAAAHNVVVVASAGNTGTDVATHPATAAGAIAVAATNKKDVLVPYSTRGSWVPLAAPACSISVNQKGEYGKYCGTSSAAPVVSGIAALLLSAKPELTPAQVLDALKKSARPVSGIGGGRVDAYRALVAVGAVPGASLAPATSSGSTTPKARRATKKVVRGRLKRHVRITLFVSGGRVTLSLASAGARACSFTLTGRHDLWFAAREGKNALRLVATVPGGRYDVDIGCRHPRRAPFKFTAVGLFS
jgi:subtilisin family serine protease